MKVIKVMRVGSWDDVIQERLAAGDRVGAKVAERLSLEGMPVCPWYAKVGGLLVQLAEFHAPTIPIGLS